MNFDAMGSELIELMGAEPEYMGRSFWGRQASRVSKVARPLAHQALSIGAKIPIASTYVAGARGAIALLPGQKAKPAGPGIVDAATTAAKGIPKSVLYGGAAVAALGLGFILMRKRQ
jgi:hypothetical protein